MPTIAGYTPHTTLREGSNTTLICATQPGTGRQVVLKVLKGEHPHNEKVHRFRNEYFLLSSFDSPYIVKTYGLETHNNTLVIVLEDWLEDFTPLDEEVGGERLPLDQFLQIAEQLTNALAVVHEGGIIHRRVTPDSILISRDRRRVRLLDFSLAMEERTTDRELRNPLLPDTIIPYISPEQSGRIEQEADHRSDLYTLGVTLFKLVTGVLPFSGTTIGEVIHAHLALPPPAPNGINRSLPAQVAAIILKLLEKIPENRYQNCQGLLHDLRHCRHMQSSKGMIDMFPLARHDQIPSLLLPHHLHSRLPEQQQLQARLTSALGGKVETVCISGEEGVGKSSLINEFIARLPRDTTIPVTTACGRDGDSLAPVATLIRQIVRHILSESSESISKRKVQILRALGVESSALTAAFPETRQIIGPQHPPDPLTPIKQQQRLYRVVGKFLKALSETGPMLVIFIDNLHYADGETLDLLHHILSSGGIRRMLFLGAYRTGVTEGTEHLERFIGALGVTIPQVEHLVLKNLQVPEIVDILTATLGHDKWEVSELAALCQRKTGGNPYFLKEFLLKSNANGNIFFNHTTQQWEWNIGKIQSSHLTRNRADFIMRSIPLLPPAARELLTTAACLGSTCPLSLISSILGHQPDKELKKLSSTGLMFTTHQDDDSRIHFSHALIRKEALHRLTPNERAAIRLRAGRHLLYTLSPRDYALRLQEIAGYLGGRHVQRVASRTERLEIAKVHLDAGRQHLEQGRYRRGYFTLEAGIRSLPQTSWETDYALTLALHTSGCESALLSGKYRQSTLHFQQVCEMARETIDTCGVYLLRIKMFKEQGRLVEAVDSTREILLRLGITLPEAPGRLPSLVKLCISWLRIALSEKRLQQDLGQLRDKRVRAILKILRACSTAAYSSRPDLLPYITDHAFRLSLTHGGSPDSMVSSLLTFSLTLCGLSPRTIPAGCRYGGLALTLINDGGEDTESQRFAYINFVSHWQEHIRESLPPLRRNLLGHPQNEFHESAANTASSLCHRHYIAGTPLSTIEGVIAEHYALVKTFNQQTALRRLGIVAEAVDNLLGKTADPLTLKGSWYNEHEAQPLCLESGDYTSYVLALIFKVVHGVLFEDYPRALDAADQAMPYLASLGGSPYIPIFYGYDSLARLASYQHLQPVEKLRTRMRVYRQQRLLQRWAMIAPQNYSHLYTLVEAERKRVLSHGEKAMELYDTAIHLAHEHQFIREEALAYELAARYYSLAKKPHISRLYQRESRYCYYRWGATAKVNRFDRLGVTDPLGNLGPALPASPSLGQGASRLDMLTVIKASRILSSEMVFDALLQKVMHIMLESGGAQKGALIFREDNDWFIRVWGTSGHQPLITPARIPVTRQDIASTAIINYVCNSARDVVLEDAMSNADFPGDPYIQENRPRSILCMPILHQGEVFCILYLENNLATGTFPPDRQELLQLLGVHAAISIKNAQLFDTLAHTVGRLNQEIDKRQEAQQQLLHAEKLSALGRLSASIAHEFGNPLMGVKYLLEDFAKRMDLGEGDRQLIGLGLEECERMKTLIHDLQRLNKPSTGKMKLTDIHTLIDHVLTFQKKHFSANNIKVFTLFDRSLPMVPVIVDQITQVLLNLTMNAVDAMPDGGQISIATKRMGANMNIAVTDTGGGIADEHREQVFEPFFSTKREEDGTGLGLSISYGIARHHGGDLTFSSRPNEGTTFTLILPLADQSSADVPKEQHRN